MANPTYTKSLFANLRNATNPIIFLDIAFIDVNASNNSTNLQTTIKEESHRLYFELFADVAPLTCENFRQFCTGESLNTISKKPYGYKNTKFHRLINNMMIQGGDFIAYDGSGSHSIYGKYFDDENFEISHEGLGFLSMSNEGKNTNGCQFFISLSSCKEFDNEYVAFGKAIDDYTIENLKRINQIRSDFSTEEPVTPISIVNCGQM